MTDRNASSPKRPRVLDAVKTMTTARAAVASLLQSTPRIAQSIAGFLAPEDRKLQRLRALRALTWAFPGANSRAFWQAMVLESFDFAVDENKTFNVEDIGQEYDPRYYYAHYDDDDADEWKDQSSFDPNPWILKAVREWTKTHGQDRAKNFLREDLAWWTQIGAYFRPSEYQFLGDLQATIGKDQWPGDEDPFTLFCDLALLHDRFRQFEDEMETYSDGDAIVFTCFLKALPEGTAVDKYSMFAHCGVIPMYWCWQYAGITDRWSRIDVEVEEKPKTGGGEEGDDEEDEDEDEDDDDEFADAVFDDPEITTTTEIDIFPGSDKKSRRALKRVIRRHFDDWRNVRITGEEMLGPTFHIGRSKLSGRWMGFTGTQEHLNISEFGRFYDNDDSEESKKATNKVLYRLP